MGFNGCEIVLNRVLVHHLQILRDGFLDTWASMSMSISSPSWLYDKSGMFVIGLTKLELFVAKRSKIASPLVSR